MTIASTSPISAQSAVPKRPSAISSSPTSTNCTGTGSCSPFRHQPGRKYWKPGDALANVLNKEHIAKLQEFGNEKRELLNTLLGADYSGEVELASIQSDIFEDRLLDFLAPEKRTAMKELERRYTAKYLNTVKDTVRGDNQSSLAALAAKDEEVLKILSPEEKLEYDLRRSNEAMYLRVALGDFGTVRAGIPERLPGHETFCRRSRCASLMAIVRGDGDPRDQTLPARHELQKALHSALGQNASPN